MTPNVSVVIPTRNRPTLVIRAVASVLAQTYRDFEVIVVIDGPDPDTAVALAPWLRKDARLRVLESDHCVGSGSARNCGIEASRGAWVALLDDDDEWLPQKLEKQLDAVKGLDLNFHQPIVCSRLIAISGDGQRMTWPRYAPSMPLCEYFFNRKSWSYGDAVLQTSTYMAPRALFQAVPFTPGLRTWDDLDWLLRATQLPQVSLLFLEEPLSHWYIWYNPGSESAHSDWLLARNWIRSLGATITPRAYAGFVATELAYQARNQKDYRQFLPLLNEMNRHGRPRLFDYALYLASWAPGSFRRSIANLLRRAR